MTRPAVTHELAPRTSRLRLGYGPDEIWQRVRPTESSDYIPNPHRGTTTFQRFNGDALNPGLTWDDDKGPTEFKPFDGTLKNPQYPDTTLSYCRWPWATLEPEHGQYRWDIIDKTLEAARVRGQTLQVLLEPWVRTPVPSWYFQFGGKPDPAAPKGADHNHPAYLKYWGGLIRAFGRRYDGHPDLESFDIGYGGPCGETGGNATPATARKLVDVYVRSFKKTPLLSMLGTPGSAYASRWKHVGWRACCFGDVHQGGWPQGDEVRHAAGVPDRLTWNHTCDAYPSSLYQCGLQDHWRTAPITWETCWTVGFWVNRKWDLDLILEEGLRYHPTVFMPKSSYIPDEVRDKIDAFDRKLGYRFVLRQLMLPLEARPGGTITLNAYVTNVGVAPLYRPYRLACRFKQGQQTIVVPFKQDLRKWLPGIIWFEETLKMPAKLQRGEVEVSLGIVAPDALQPAVEFAIQERGPDRWHPMTTMDVV